MEKISFGKHKGTELGNLPVSYLKWLAGQEISHSGKNWSEMASRYLKNHNLGAYISPDEWESADQARRWEEQDDEDFRNENCVEWTAKSGQFISVLVDGSRLFLSIDNHLSSLLTPVRGKLSRESFVLPLLKSLAGV